MEIGGKGQGMPIHVIIVLILGIIVLAAILFYVFGVFQESGDSVVTVFDIGANVTNNSSESVKGLFG